MEITLFGQRRHKVRQNVQRATRNINKVDTLWRHYGGNVVRLTLNCVSANTQRTIRVWLNVMIKQNDETNKMMHKTKQQSLAQPEM